LVVPTGFEPVLPT